MKIILVLSWYYENYLGIYYKKMRILEIFVLNRERSDIFGYIYESIYELDFQKYSTCIDRYRCIEILKLIDLI